MAKRYYYDDPIKALWMRAYFDFKIQQTYDGHRSYSEVGSDDIAEQVSDLFPQSNYLNPNCYEMLKPQVGDLCGDGSTFGLYGGEGLIAVPMRINGKDFYRPARLDIIQRNGMPFFMPEVEEIEEPQQRRGGL